MPNIMDTLNANPTWQQGLAMMRGDSPEVAAKTAAYYQNMQAQQEEKARAEQTRQALGQALAGGLNPEKINEIMAIDPDMGIKLLNMYQRQQRESMRMEMLQGAFGGGGGSADRIAAYSMATGDTSMLPLATFMQGRENREQDYLRKLEEESRKEQRLIDKESRKPPTESQANAATFATRMAEAEQLLTPLEQSGVSTADIGERAAAGVPLVGNYLTSGEFKQYNQAASDWVRAKLRKESGAVIGEEEMEREIKTYFPQPGDTPSVIEQKRKARETAMVGFANAARPGFKLPELPKSETGGNVINFEDLP